MKLMYKINLVGLAVLVVVGLAMAAAGVSTISRVIYDLHRELMSREVDNVVATIQGTYDVLVENRLDRVESYNRKAQADVVFELEKYSYGETGLLIIVTDDEKVVKHEGLEAGQPCELPHVAAMVRDQSGTMKFSHGGQQRFFSYKLFPQWNWLIILSVTSEEMLAARSQFVRLGVGILLISLVIGAMVFVWFIRRVVGPIRQLAEATTYVSEGKWDAPLPQSKGSDEIAQLTAAFRRMAGRLGEIYGSLEKNLQQIKRSRSALRDSEEKLRAANQALEVVYRCSQAAIVTLDRQNRVTFWNPAAEKMFGWKAEEIMGKPYPAVPEELIRDFNHLMHEQMAKGRAYTDLTLVRMRKDGTRFYVSATTGPLRDKNDQIIGLISLMTDITRRKQAEEALRDSEERYKALYKEAKETEERYHSLIGSTLDAIVIYDIDGHTTYVNNAFTQMFGWVLEEIADGVPYVPDSEREVTMQHIKNVSQDGLALKDVETRRLTKEGDLVDVSISASRFNDHEGNPAGMLVILRDITQSKQAMAELREHRDHLEELVNARTVELATAKEQAEAANAAKSDFLARMSHEIRTPLNAVTGLTNIVIKSELTTEQRDYLNKVQIASNNLLEVINDILDFSKVEAGRLELEQHPFDLDQIMAQLADLFSDQIAEKDLKLIFSVSPKVSRQLKGDGSRLSQVLINLIQNALKFTKSGKIVVGVEQEAQPAKDHAHAVFKFWVSDTGTGIAADELHTLFEPFTQAEGYLTRKHEGTGLGLAICRRLVELMGGRIWAESTPGRGSTFSFTVLFEPQEEEKPQLSLPADLHGVKALVVDESTEARQVLADALEYLAFNVTAVDSSEKAIQALDRTPARKPYQLVLMDWKIPDMDGIKTAAAIDDKPDLHTPPIIMVTAYEHELAQKGMDTASVDTVLLKPVRPTHLYNAMMDHFGQAEAIATHHEHEPAARLIHRLAGRRVLVVEDSELNRDVAMALLEEAGLSVEIAENGQIAVDKVIGSPRGHYNAVLMDIQMPVMDGYEATRCIRQWEFNAQDKSAGRSIHHLPTADYRIPIIALTAHALKGEKEKCLAADMDDYLPKPLDEQDLHRVLLKWISSQQEKADTSG